VTVSLRRSTTGPSALDLAFLVAEMYRSTV